MLGSISDVRKRAGTQKHSGPTLMRLNDLLTGRARKYLQRGMKKKMIIKREIGIERTKDQMGVLL